MSRKARGDQPVGDQVTVQASNFEEFVAAVRHVLVKAHETPPMVVDHLLDADHVYVRKAWDDVRAGEEDLGALVVEVADELAFRPAKGKREWVLATENSVVVEVTPSVREHLARLTGVGLYGEEEQEVATAMMLRGIECVIHMMPTAVRR